MGRGKSTHPIEIDGADCDAWSWEKEITGRCTRTACSGSPFISVNGREIRARRRGGHFQAVVRLDEGKNEVTVLCRSGERQCCSRSIVISQKLRRRPTARIEVAAGEDRVELNGRGSEPSGSEGSRIARYAWRSSGANPAPLTDTRGRRRWQGQAVSLTLPPKDGEYRASLHVTDTDGRRDRSATCFQIENGKPRATDILRPCPAWVERAVVYGTFPPHFGPDGFDSVISRLASLEDLGVDALWLSPLNPTTGGGHGYDVDDYFGVRRDYGTKRDLRHLVKEAHRRGIRILMDFVPNHTSENHRYLADVRTRGARSPYRDFYERGESETDHSYYFDWVNLANLNYANPEVQRWIIEAFSYWVREFGIDGFRVDAAWGVQRRQPDFWPKWVEELKRIDPELFLLTEASARDPYWFTHGFDAAYDWTDDLGCWSMADVFEEPSEISSRLHTALTNEGRGFHENALIFRFLNNNDTGPRFLTRYGVAMERVAAVMLLTLPGVPCIYTGQEVGAEFEPYRTAGAISWEDRHGLRDYYRRLIALRHQTRALHSREWEVLRTRSEAQTYAYARYGPEGDEPIIVALNFTPRVAKTQIELTTRSSAFAGRSRAFDLLTDKPIKLEPRGKRALLLSLPPHSALVLSPA